MSLKSGNEMCKIGNYVYEPQPIGQGSFAKVYKGYHYNSKTEVAIKAIYLDNKKIPNRKLFAKRISNEIKIMLQLQHPNIITLYDYSFSDDFETVYLIMEYCPSDLNVYLKEKGKLSEKEANNFFCQICDGLKYLLSEKILHRDLKPHNFLLTADNKIKITDFSFAKIFEPNTMSSTICGSPLYMAPELLKGEIYTNKSDLWSLGVILYQLLFDKYPYYADTPYTLIEKIQNKPLSLPVSNISDDCILLIHDLLKIDVLKRITWIDLFENKWLLKYNYKGMIHSIQFNKKVNFDQYLESDFYIIDDFDSFLIPSESNEPKKIKNQIISYLLSYII